VAELEDVIEKKQAEIDDLKIALSDLDDPRTLEKYAREHHYFKKDDEDLFIFSFE
jgi:cell division protein FtsB